MPRRVVTQKNRPKPGKDRVLELARQAGVFLADRPSQVISEVYDFCESVGLPTTLADIGIPDATDDDLRIVAEAA